MQYLLSALIILFVIYFIESKLKERIGNNIFESFKNNFNVINLVSFSVLLASFMLLVSILLENANIFVSSRGQFSISSLPYIIFSVTFVPLIEEYIYRYLPYRIINYPKYDKHIAVISSLIFSFSHSAKGLEYFYIFCIAMIFSYIFLKTQNVLYPICSHSFYNVLVYLNFYMGFDNIVILSIVIIICVLVLCRKILIKKLTS